jgi:hypothetical protein
VQQYAVLCSVSIALELHVVCLLLLCVSVCSYCSVRCCSTNTIYNAIALLQQRCPLYCALMSRECTAVAVCSVAVAALAALKQLLRVITINKASCLYHLPRGLNASAAAAAALAAKALTLPFSLLLLSLSVSSCCCCWCCSTLLKATVMRNIKSVRESCDRHGDVACALALLCNI